MADQTRRAVVVGAGTMGVGIAYVLGLGGFVVDVVEPDDDRATRLRETIAAQAERGQQRGKLTAAVAAELPGRVRRHRRIEELDPGADVAIESIPERFELKRQVLSELEQQEPRLLATNTSSLSIDRLADGLRAPEGFLGMHFFNPVWSLALVEIVRGSRTGEDALARARDVVVAIGKEAVVVRDVPGFATSRLDLIAALEAMRMVQDGVASVEDVDRAVTLAYRHPVGPLRLSDIVGLDVRLDIAESLERVYGERYAPPAILREMVAQGRLGEKVGRGFYEWPR